MTNPVEAMVRAMYQAEMRHHGLWEFENAEVPAPEVPCYEASARAALQALKDNVSEEMKKTGMYMMGHCVEDNCEEGSTHTFQAMIDTAMKEETDD